VWDGSARVGCFCGLIFSRFGIRILGSPFPGWATMYMGFNLEPGVPRLAALKALREFAFRELGCLHVEVTDRMLTPADGEQMRMDPQFFFSYESDLTRTEEQLFADMTSQCRGCIRKAEKCGLRIEEAEPNEGFAELYYKQLEDVFAKQGLRPIYDIGMIRALFKHVGPSGQLLLLRARDPDGNCIGSGIYAGLDGFAQMWGNASFRGGQHFRPNEAMHWHAIRYWRRRGAQCFDWGGEGKYKEKYGCKKVVVPRFSKSRFPILTKLRNEAALMFYRTRGIKGWLAGVSKEAA
jgi:predicted N-acyltransferase